MSENLRAMTGYLELLEDEQLDYEAGLEHPEEEPGPAFNQQINPSEQKDTRS